MPDSPVIRNETLHQYEVWVDGALAGFCRFREQPGRVLFIHTEIDEDFEGRGLGSLLARAALEDAVSRGETIVPYCPFIAAYLRRHTDFEADVEWPELERPAGA